MLKTCLLNKWDKKNSKWIHLRMNYISTVERINKMKTQDISSKKEVICTLFITNIWRFYSSFIPLKYGVLKVILLYFKFFLNLEIVILKFVQIRERLICISVSSNNAWQVVNSSVHSTNIWDPGPLIGSRSIWGSKDIEY